MKVDKLQDLAFKKIDVEFDDGKTLYTAFLKGKFTRFDILNKMESLAEKFRKEGKKGYVGVAVHYKDPNGWLPAIYNSVNKSMKLYNPSDSTTTKEYKDIDGVYFYFAEMPEGKELNQKMHKVKKANTAVENMFIH